MLGYLRRKRQRDSDDTCLIVCGDIETRLLLAKLSSVMPEIVAYLKAEKIYDNTKPEITIDDLVRFMLHCKEEIEIDKNK